MKCESCNVKLVEVQGYGYIHPRSNTCSEDDGFRIDEDARHLWNKNHPAPQTYEVEELKKDIKFLEEQNEHYRKQRLSHLRQIADMKNKMSEKRGIKKWIEIKKQDKKQKTKRDLKKQK